MVGFRPLKNFDDTFSRFDTIPYARVTDGQTDVRNWRGIYDTRVKTAAMTSSHAKILNPSVETDPAVRTLLHMHPQLSPSPLRACDVIGFMLT